MDLTDSVVQQLLDRAKLLREVADQLWRGEQLHSAVSKAQDPSVWAGAPQLAFCRWLEGLDRWLREPLSAGVGQVAEGIERHARDLEDAQRKVVAGIPGAACPAPPGRVGTTPGRPPEFVMQFDHSGGAVAMAPKEMETLVTILGRTKDDLLATGRQVEGALAPPTVPPDLTGTQVAAQLPPADHLPPDAADTAGWPGAWQALAIQLERALQDVLSRAREWALAGAADSASHSGGLLGGLAGLGGALGRAMATAPVPSEAERLAREEGTADAAQFAALAWGKKGRCPDFEDLAQFLGAVRTKGAVNPAYTEGFTAVMGARHHEAHGLDEGNGFERFSRTVETCWTNRGKHENDAAERLLAPMGEVFTMATQASDFDIGLAHHLLESGLGGEYVFAACQVPLRTDVALAAAEHFIDGDDWEHGRNPDSIATGLRILTANPEAANEYAAGHPDLLSRGTNPDLFHEPGGGGLLGEWDGPWDNGVGALAADVLRIGLVEYPVQLAANAIGDAAGRAAQERLASEGAMGAAIEAVGQGAKPGPEGRLLLAGFVASHIGDVAGCLKEPDDPNLHLRASQGAIKTTLKEIAGDPAARGVVLAGAGVAIADWSADLARRTGAGLADNPTLPVTDVVASKSRMGEAHGPGSRLGTFYGELGNAVMANAEDTEKAAAEVAGILGFFVSRVAGDVAKVAGAAVGGGVGGIVAAYGADSLGKGVEAYIKHAQEELAEVKDAKKLKAAFMDMVTKTMEQATAVSLWADDRIRAGLLAPRTDQQKAESPPKEFHGSPIVPPLEDPPGHLRIPAPDEQPAYQAFNEWFDSPAARPLRAAAAAGLQDSGMLPAFDRTLLEGLFKKG